MKEYHLDRLVYVCTCEKGLKPHIHWDIYTSGPAHLDHPEPEPTGAHPVEKPK